MDLVVTKVFTNNEIEEVVNLCDYEVDTFLCQDVPKYQSSSEMHLKYLKHRTFKKLLDVVDSGAKRINNNYKMTKCWFNVSRKDSNGWQWHTHPTKLTAVFYLKNTHGNGTIFNKNGDIVQNLGLENTIEYFDPVIPHTIDPAWKGQDRYTVAFDFE
jgi:hypothetical protein